MDNKEFKLINAVMKEINNLNFDSNIDTPTELITVKVDDIEEWLFICFVQYILGRKRSLEVTNQLLEKHFHRLYNRLWCLMFMFCGSFMTTQIVNIIDYDYYYVVILLLIINVNIVIFVPKLIEYFSGVRYKITIIPSYGLYETIPNFAKLCDSYAKIGLTVGVDLAYYNGSLTFSLFLDC